MRKAAIEVISEVGFFAANTDKIAQEAGVSVGTIYNYFANKDDILAYIFEVEHRRARQFFQDLAQKQVGAKERVLKFCQWYFDSVYKNKKLCKILHNESNRPANGLSSEIIDYLSLINDFLQNLLEGGIVEGSVREDIDTEMMAAVVIGAVNSIALRGYLQPDRLYNLCQKAPGELEKIFLAGIFTTSGRKRG
ncbi:MAG: TetR/AcrR family transcriptional regulator [Halanaerobium sp.]|nr:TetR/AcrR family transcriptional regulator [Halanaerobium sp.]